MKRHLLIIIALLLPISSGSQQIPKLKKINEKYANEDILPLEKKGKWGFANSENKFRIKPIFDEVEPFHGFDYGDITIAKVCFRNKWGYLSSDGTFYVNPIYEELHDYINHIAVCKKDNGYGILSSDGNELIDGLDYVDDFGESGHAFFKKNNKWGVLFVDGSVVINSESDVRPIKIFDDLYTVKKEDKFGVISLLRNDYVIPYDCDTIFSSITKSFSNIIYKSSGKYGILSSDRLASSGAVYDSIEYYHDGMYIVKQDEKYGLIDNNGHVLLPSIVNTQPTFGPIRYFSNSIHGSHYPHVYSDGKQYTYDEYDDFLYSEDQRQSTHIPKTYSRLHQDIYIPDWMKKHLGDYYDDDNYKKKWIFEYSVFPSSKGVESINLSDLYGKCVINDNVDFILFKHDNPQVFNTNFEYNEVFYSDDFPREVFIKLLNSLTKSIKTDKINSFDLSHGTDIYKSWSIIHANLISYNTLYDGTYLVSIELSISNDDWKNGYNYPLELVIAAINNNGSFKILKRIDGYAYCGIAELPIPLFYDFDTCFIVWDFDSNIEIISLNDHKTSVHVNPFKQLFRKGSLYYLLSNNRFYSINNQGNHYRDYFILDDKERIYLTDYMAFIIDEDTMLAKKVAPINKPSNLVPIITYTQSMWDGEIINAISKNYWSSPYKSQWKYINAKSKKDSEVYHLDDLVVTIYKPILNGLTKYSVKKKGEDFCGFGLIGLTEKFLTFPIFDDIQVVSSDSFKVTIGDDTRTIGIDSMRTYMPDPRGRYQPYLFPIGEVVFSENQLKASYNREVFILEENANIDGYVLLNDDYGNSTLKYYYLPTNSFGLADREGRLLTSPMFDRIRETRSNKLIAALIFDSRTKTKKIKTYISEETISDDYYYGWGFLDKYGHTVIPFEYSYDPYEHDFDDNKNIILEKITSEGLPKQGCYNENGELIIPFEYDSIELDSNTGNYKLTKGEVTSYADKCGVTLSDIK